MNRGPDGVAVQLLASYAWDSAFNCFSDPDVRNLWDLGYLGASGVASFDITNDFTCYGTADSSTSGTMYLRVGASPSTGGAFDPDMENNYWARQSPFSVIGSAPIPTEPVDGGPTPTPNDQFPVTGSSPTPTAGASTSPSDQGTGGGPSGSPSSNLGSTVAQANIQIPAAAALGAAALPQTGEAGSESQTDWLLLLVAGGGLGMTAAAVTATRRLLGHRC